MNRWKCPRCTSWTFDEMAKICLDCKEEEEMPRQPRSREGWPDWWTTDDWSTPPEVFEPLEREHGPFDLDPAAREETSKGAVCYTKEENGLLLPWFGTVWVNPPYSDPAAWCKKAIEELREGNCTKVVMLLPAAVDTKWFHTFVMPYAGWYPMRGRSKFLGFEGKPIGSPKGGCVVAVFPKESRS